MFTTNILYKMIRFRQAKGGIRIALTLAIQAFFKVHPNATAIYQTGSLKR